MFVLLLALRPAGAAPLRDPFARAGRPPAGSAAAADAAAVVADAGAAARPAPPPPRLRAILFAHGKAFADIDGLVLREGDRAGDWQVVGIEERRVRLKRGDASLVLQFDRETGR